ncbi:MAG: DUF4442 domain-containing protein [Catenulispora sp.]|nr:DUF4442 domain-containing protein [Catenulispora sp.]
MTAETAPETASATASFDIGAFLTAAVPMVGTLGLEYVETTTERAVLKFRDQAEYRNHVGGPHAGAMFTLAESASGAIVVAAFGHLAAEATPLPTTATIDFKKMARGDITATATLGRPIPEILAELEGGTRPEFPVHVQIQRDNDDAVTGEMTIVWTLRPNN